MCNIFPVSALLYELYVDQHDTKPDLGLSVSSSMNNSPCSGWCATANGRHMLEYSAGLPLMFLSRLSQIILVLNHSFPPP